MEVTDLFAVLQYSLLHAWNGIYSETNSKIDRRSFQWASIRELKQLTLDAGTTQSTKLLQSGTSLSEKKGQPKFHTGCCDHIINEDVAVCNKSLRKKGQPQFHTGCCDHIIIVAVTT